MTIDLPAIKAAAEAANRNTIAPRTVILDAEHVLEMVRRIEALKAAPVVSREDVRRQVESAIHAAIGGDWEDARDVATDAILALFQKVGEDG